jgi:hypothetical protein
MRPSDIELIDIDMIHPRRREHPRIPESYGPWNTGSSGADPDQYNENAKLYAGEIITDFMAPRLKRGAIVLIDPGATIRPGKLALIDIEGSLSLGYATNNGTILHPNTAIPLHNATPIAAVVRFLSEK